ncbi:MAG: cupin domain-containing protein [Oscillospiraceae bacterium]|nr:cupin domain-containing protein [Oscillospiraceae bacterium]
MNLFDLPELPLVEELTTVLAERRSGRGGPGGSDGGGAGSGRGGDSDIGVGGVVDGDIGYTGDNGGVGNGGSSVANVPVGFCGVRIERIVSTGQVSGWYDQAETEFVALLEGAAEIEYEGGRRLALSRGDTLIIKPHERHKVAYTSSDPPCIWLCVFY